MGAAANAVAGVAEDVAAIPGTVASLPDKAEEAYAALEWALSPERTREEKDAFWRLTGKGAAGGAAVLAERTLGRLAGAALGKGGLRPDLADFDDGLRSYIYPPKGPYDPRGTRKALEEKYGKEPVTSTTVPPSRSKGVRFQNKSGVEAMKAGLPSPVTGAPHPRTGRMFDRRGEPNFETVTAAEVDIKNPTRDPSRRDLDKTQAMKELRDMLEAHPASRGRFSRDQLEKIDSKAGSSVLDNVWDHKRRWGRLGSVDADVHGDNGHLGPFPLADEEGRRDRRKKK